MVGVVSDPPIAQFVFVPPGDWQPDVPSPSNDGMVAALNLIPRSNGFYGPERALVDFFNQSTTEFGTALKVNGPIHSVPPAPGDDVQIFVGTFATAANASRILTRTEQGAWSNVSRAPGYTTTARTPWSFANFGNNVIAANRNTRTQISSGGAAVFTDIANAPQFESIATVAGFLMGVNYNDQAFGGGLQPFRAAWSAIGNPNLPISADVPAGGWPDPGSDFAPTVQSGFSGPLVGGGRLQRIIPGVGGADAVIIGARKVWRVNYVGPPQVFQFDEVEADQGTTVPGSIAVHNETLFLFGQNGFYFFDGQNMTPIGQGQMDEFFNSDLDFAADFGLQAGVAATIDAVNKNYVLAYRSVSQAAETDNNDRILRFNWLTRKWSNSEQQIDSMGSLDNNASRTDSPVPIAIGSDFQLKQFTGSTLEASMTMAESFDTQGGYTEVQGYMPIIDTDDVEVAMRVRDQLNQTPVETTLRGLSQHGSVPFDIDHVNGRFYACRIRVPAGSTWTNFQGGAYEVMAHGRGSRSGAGNP